MKIYISGLYCGTNPQPGVGIARSLRAGYPEATLVGVEYSNRSSGLHWTDFDELWLQRPWDELSLEDYGARIGEILDSGALWISGSDLESLWLSDVFPDGHPNLLTPPGGALRRIAKPAVPAHEGLPVRVPTFISTDCSDWEIHSFCRQHDWRVWLKGPYYDAARVGCWPDFEAVRAALTNVWATERLFMQAHVSGYEESVVLSAYRGELAGVVRMRKREITPEGKTWAGDVTEPPEEFVAPLREIARKLNWTGGAEIEMVRDVEGQLWLLEWNPRFPAWIHGATIAGRNMPALLVEAATGVPAQEERPVSEEFTRVVLEVPVRPQLPLPPLPEPFAGAVGHSLKHPSGLPALAERLHKLNPEMLRGAAHADVQVGANGNGNGDGAVNGNGGANGNGAKAAAKASANGESNGAGRRKAEVTCAPEVPASFVRDISTYKFAEVATPSWLFLDDTASEIFGRAAGLAAGLTTDEVTVTNAYSIKTNPDERLIKLALDRGFLAEAISLLEVQKALAVGFKPEQVVLNGPGKWWPEGLMPREEMRAVFCDSVADLKRVVAAMGNGELKAKTVGVRLRTPHIASRFGIPVHSPETFESLVEAVGLLPADCGFGIHFHMASSNVGVGQWWHLYESMLRWCRSVETLTGRAVETLDVGGGWFPDDWHEDSGSRFAGAVERARRHLPNLREVISEPGKAMAQPSMALAMRLLEVQEMDEGEIEAVVDGSIAELPMYAFQPHRILGRDPASGEWRPLGRGKTRLMGRLCMEHDVVAWNVELPEGVGAGDVLIFCDAGAYDRSMSYVFGRG